MNKEKDNDLLVIKKAKWLAKYTLEITANINHYPKKFRYSLVDKMQNRCLEIYMNLHEANRTDIKDYKRHRLELQTRAITYCDQLNFFIELSHEMGFISEKSMEYWSKSVKEVKAMAIAWRTADRKR